MAAIGNIHNIRVVRFLLVVSLATLTIFIYASYSSNTPLTPPPSPLQPQPHALRSIVDQQQLITANKSIDAAGVLTSFGNNGIDSIAGGGGNQDGSDSSLLKLNRKAAVISAGGTSGGGISNGGDAAKLQPAQNAAAANIVKKQHQHREPTIDVDAVNDEGGQHDEARDEDDLEHFGNELLEDGDVQNIDNALVVGSINNSNTSSAQQNNNGAAPQEQSKPQLDQQQNQANEEKSGVDNGNNNADKILDTDVMIPTSNLQKFIENADKILKNITGSAPTNDKPADNKVIPHINVEPVKDSNNNKKQLPEEEKAKGEAAKDNGGGGDAALPPSVVMTIKRPDQQQQQQQQKQPQPQKAQPKQQQPQQKPTENHTPIKIPVKSPLPLNNTDHSKGIPMTEIYESGHLNDEIDTAKVCPKNGDELKLLILISSAPTHADARLAIRQTWAHYGTRRDVSIGFVLGRTTNDSIYKELSIENFIYGDMIRGNFIDSYSNLTLKTISTLEWIDLHCSHAKYILKTDDDMFINVPKLLQFIDGHAKQKRVIYGRLAKNWKPIRNKKSKYYVSNEQFSQAVFPAFTTGPAYLFTNDIVHALYERSLQQVYLKLEDVFTTGIVAQQLGIKRVHANEFLNRRVAFNPCNIRKLISVHMIKANEQFDLWKKLLDKSTKCK